MMDLHLQNLLHKNLLQHKLTLVAFKPLCKNDMYYLMLSVQLRLFPSVAYMEMKSLTALQMFRWK